MPDAWYRVQMLTSHVYNVSLCILYTSVTSCVVVLLNIYDLWLGRALNMDGQVHFDTVSHG